MQKNLLWGKGSNLWEYCLRYSDTLYVNFLGEG